MTKLLLILGLALLFSSFVAAETVPKDEMMKAVRQSTKSMFLAAVKGAEKDECHDNVMQLRKVWFYLPPNLKESLLLDVISQLASQFPRLPYEQVERLVRNFVDDKVEPRQACDYAWRILSEEARRRQECVEACVEEADLTPERLIRTVMKCGLDFNCYMQEIEETMQSLAICIQGCIMPNDVVPWKPKLLLNKSAKKHNIKKFFRHLLKKF